MKRRLIAAVFTLGLIGNACAACDAMPYNAPEELQPPCAQESPIVPNTETVPADKAKANGNADAAKDPSADATEKRKLEKSSQSENK